MITHEILGGHVFLHLSMEKFTPDTAKQIRKEFEGIKTTFSKQGYEMVFANTSDPRVVDMWDIIHPCHEVIDLGGKGYLGTWLTEENE